MAELTGVRVEGLSAAVRALKQLGLEVEDLKGAFSTIASEAAGAIRAETPRRSGRLAGTVRGNRAQSKAVVTVGRSTVPYAGVIRYGWPARHIPPNDYAGRGEQKYTPTAIHRLEQEIEAAIRRKGLHRR
ncbi:hypothetical protein GCM10023340_36410 [Nocardioides marinquilinus]|uniref:HK97 gp10 family phage protein n=1 Tax=Nocardioides marinquilinus TaxID=1210400 RepID=A0ABP9Q1M3_9ACTN